MHCTEQMMEELMCKKNRKGSKREKDVKIWKEGRKHVPLCAEDLR